MCDDPNAPGNNYLITVQNQPDFAYTITDTARAINVPAFTITPDFCTVEYTATISKLADGSEPVTVTNVATNRDFQVEYAASLIPAVNSETIKVEVIATSKTIHGSASNPTTKKVAFDVTFANPCLNEQFVSINGPADLPELEYIPETGPKTFDAHVGFALSIQPTSHSLCGNLKLTGVYDSNDLTASSKPLAYDSVTRKFTADSDDVGLVDT